MTVDGSYAPERRDDLAPLSSRQAQQCTDLPAEDNPLVSPDMRQVIPGTSNVYRTDWHGEL